MPCEGPLEKCMVAVSQSSFPVQGVFLSAAWCHPKCLSFTTENSGTTKTRSQTSSWSVETLCITLQTESGHRACLSGFCKWLIIPLGWVVNENSNSSSLFQLGGKMGDTSRYLCCGRVYLEGCTKPCFFKHRRSQNNSKNKIYFLNLFLSQPPPKIDANILPKSSDFVQIFFCFYRALLFPLHLKGFFPYSNKHVHHTPGTTLCRGTAVQSRQIPKKHPGCLLQGAGEGEVRRA